MADRGLLLILLGGTISLIGLLSLFTGHSKTEGGTTVYEFAGFKFTGPGVVAIILIGAGLAYLGAAIQPPTDDRPSSRDVAEKPVVLPEERTNSTSQRPDPTLVSEPGWVYFGEREDDKWNERFFQIEGRGPLVVPKAGDTIVATGDVNMRSGPIQSKGGVWVNQPKVGVVVSGTRLRVKDVKEIEDGYFWVRVR